MRSKTVDCFDAALAASKQSRSPRAHNVLRLVKKKKKKINEKKRKNADYLLVIGSEFFCYSVGAFLSLDNVGPIRFDAAALRAQSI